MSNFELIVIYEMVEESIEPERHAYDYFPQKYYEVEVLVEKIYYG